MTKPKPYQRKGNRLISKFGGRVVLADEMGVGKTFQVLYWLHKHKGRRPVVVVCPANVKFHWQMEADKHFGMTSGILNGRRSYDTDTKLVDPHRPILIVNYEILHNWVDYLVSLNPSVVVFDECHYLQNRGSLRSKAAQFLVNEANVPNRIGISGTPLTNCPAELWTTLHILRPDRFGSFAAFAFRYCFQKVYKGRVSFRGARNTAELHRRLGRLCMIRRLKKDVLKELPKKVHRVLPIEIPRRAEYLRAVDDFLGWLRGISPAKANRAKRSLELTRVGYLLRLLSRLKRKQVRIWIKDFLIESSGKLVVFTMHRQVVQHLQKKFRRQCAIIDGSVTGIKRQRAIDEFQNNPRIRLVICNIKAGGVGISLTAAADVFYADLPWTPGALKQSADRIHRIGQKGEQCTYHYMVVRNSIEERLCQMLRSKENDTNAVLDGGKQRNEFDIFNAIIREARKGPKK